MPGVPGRQQREASGTTRGDQAMTSVQEPLCRCTLPCPELGRILPGHSPPAAQGSPRRVRRSAEALRDRAVPARGADQTGPPSSGQYGRSGCVWLYAVIDCSGMLPSRASSNPARIAQLLTSAELACHREPVISAPDSRARAIRMASPTSSAARRVRFMARWSNTARESSSTGRPGRSRSSVRTVSASSSRLKTLASLSNRPTRGTRRHLTTLASRPTSGLAISTFSCPVRRSAGHTISCHAR